MAFLLHVTSQLQCVPLVASPHIMNMQHVEETKYTFLIWSCQIPIKTPHFNSPKLEILEGSIYIIIF